MKKLVLFIFILTCALSKAQVRDTIQFERLKLETIKIDTLAPLSDKEIITMIHLTFTKEDKSLFSISFPEVLGQKQTSIIYNWTPTASIYNFNLVKGSSYRIEMSPVCMNDLNKESFYLKYADFSSDNCQLNNAFNKSKYNNDYKRSIFHFCHSNRTLYQIYSFSLAMPEKAQDPLMFLPVNLKFEKKKTEFEDKE